MFSIYDVIAIVVLSHIMWWSIKKLIAHYFIQYLERKRFCVRCLDNGNGRLNFDAAWTVKGDGEVPLYLCDSCKREAFPAEVGQFAEDEGLLIRDGRD